MVASLDPSPRQERAPEGWPSSGAAERSKEIRLVLGHFAASLVITLGLAYLVALWADSAVAGCVVFVVGIWAVYVALVFLTTRGGRR